MRKMYNKKLISKHTILKLEKMSSPHKRQYKAMKSQLEHILHRPDTYVGSGRQQTYNDSHVGDITSVTPVIKKCSVKYIPAMLRIFVEIVSNAIDNIYRSEEEKVPMSKIKVTIDQDIEVSTNKIIDNISKKLGIINTA